MYARVCRMVSWASLVSVWASGIQKGPLLYESCVSDVKYHIGWNHLTAEKLWQHMGRGKAHERERALIQLDMASWEQDTLARVHVASSTDEEQASTISCL